MPTPPVFERRQPLRFVWRMDADGHFTIESEDFIRLAGERTANTRLQEAASAYERDRDVAYSELETERQENLQLRNALDEWRRNLENVRTALEEERGANAQLREAAERAKRLLTTLGQQKSALQARHQELTIELGRTRESLAELDRLRRDRRELNRES